MTAKIMVVDDNPTNLLLLTHKLSNEMYSVITTDNPKMALELAKQHLPDVILLDVVMPGMNGIQVCEQLKNSAEVGHIPVLLLSALDAKSDRVDGLQVGADDFLTVPINDIVLFMRLKSLIRIKTLLDELRMRSQTVATLLKLPTPAAPSAINIAHARVLVVEDDHGQSDRIVEVLGANYSVIVAKTLDETLQHINGGESFDLMIVNSYLRTGDGIKLAAYVKGLQPARHLPIILMLSEANTQAMLRALQLGMNDYLCTPIDANELLARVQTQIRRKKYKESLRGSYRSKESVALLDEVSGVFNRAYFEEHLKSEVAYAHQTGKHLSLMLLDLKKFASVNQQLGDAGGDKVLHAIAAKIMDATRTADIAMRYENDCFGLILPDTDYIGAEIVAERIRRSCSRTSFHIKDQLVAVETSLNIGIASFDPKAGRVSEESLKALAMQNLNQAKQAAA